MAAMRQSSEKCLQEGFGVRQDTAVGVRQAPAWNAPMSRVSRPGLGSPLSYPSYGITPIVPFITSRIHHTSVENNTGTFTEVLRELKAQRKEERWKTYNTWKRSCCCPDCPSYNECASRGQELLYCILGMSNSCIRDDRHCTCRECPLYTLLGLTGKDFCMKGSEAAMRFERTVE